MWPMLLILPSITFFASTMESVRAIWTVANGTLLSLEFADRMAIKGSEPTSGAFTQVMDPDPKLAKRRGSHRHVTLCSLNRNGIGRTLSFVNVHSFNGKG